MRKYLLFFGLLAICGAAIFGTMAAGSPAQEYQTVVIGGEVWKQYPSFSEQSPEGYLVGPDGTLLQSFRRDTLTNTANDTLNVSSSLTLPYQTTAHLELTTLSGTRAAKLYVDEAVTLASGVSDWCAVDSLTLNAGKTACLNRNTVQGRKYRYRLDGTAGATQSLAYTAHFLAKPTFRR